MPRQTEGANKVGISIISHGGIGKSDANGATERNLTASCHELAIGCQDSAIRILNDCGGYQWTGVLERNIEHIADGTNFIVLTHPHMDHIGDLARLFTGGKTYAGRIIATPGTKRAAEVALKDAAKIQMEFYTRAMVKFEEARKDINKLIYTVRSFKTSTSPKTSSGQSLRKSNEASRKDRYETAKELLKVKYDIIDIDEKWEDRLAPSSPAFVMEDVERTIAHIETQTIADGWKELVPWKVNLRFYNAGHIIGSAMALYEIKDEAGKPHKVLFSGDIGSYKWDLHINGVPTPPNNDPIDAVVIESTYGGKVRDKFEEGRGEYEDSLVNAFKDTSERKAYNRVIHACFSLDRLQNMLFRVVSLKKEWKIDAPIYVDSPMWLAYIQAYITEARRTLAELKTPHQESIRRAVGDDYIEREKKFLEEFIDCLNPANGNYIPVTTSTERETLMRDTGDTTKKIIITASGMANWGPIIPYLSTWAKDPQSAFYFPGYLAEWTLGHQLAGPKKIKQDGIPEYPTVKEQVTISGNPTTINAQMKNFTFLSWHADEEDLLVFLEAIKFRKDSKIIVVHGDITVSSKKLKDTLIDNNYQENNIVVPDINEEIIIRQWKSSSLLREFNAQVKSLLLWRHDHAGITHISNLETKEILESELALIEDALEHIDGDFANKDATDKENHRGDLEWRRTHLIERIASIQTWSETLESIIKQKVLADRKNRVPVRTQVKKTSKEPGNKRIKEERMSEIPTQENSKEHKAIRTQILELKQWVDTIAETLTQKTEHLNETIYHQLHSGVIGELKRWIAISRHIKELEKQRDMKKSQQKQKTDKLNRVNDAQSEITDPTINARKKKRLQARLSTDVSELDVEIELLWKDISRLDEEIDTLGTQLNKVFSGIESEEDVVKRCLWKEHKVSTGQKRTNERIQEYIEKWIRHLIRESIEHHPVYQTAQSYKERLRSEQSHLSVLLELANTIAEKNGTWDILQDRIWERKKTEKHLAKEIRRIDTGTIVHDVTTKLAL